MATRKKRYLEITETLRELSIEFFEGSLIQLMAELQGFMDDYPDHKDLEILIDHYCESVDIELRGTRLETDKERDKRLAKARKERERKAEMKASREVAEKQELKRLLEKYGEELIQ
jgi:hypothetical protein